MSAAEGSGLRVWHELPETMTGNRQVGCRERRKVAEKVTPEQERTWWEMKVGELYTEKHERQVARRM